jgi:hypothetical protein
VQLPAVRPERTNQRLQLLRRAGHAAEQHRWLLLLLLLLLVVVLGC